MFANTGLTERNLHLTLVAKRPDFGSSQLYNNF